MVDWLQKLIGGEIERDFFGWKVKGEDRLLLDRWAKSAEKNTISSLRHHYPLAELRFGSPVNC